MNTTQKYNYLFLMPLGGYGGLEMENIKKARLAIENGNGAVVVGLTGTKTEEQCARFGIPFENIEIKVKYIDLKAVNKLRKIQNKYSTSIIVVAQTQFISFAILSNKFAKEKAAIVLYQQMISGLKKKDFFHNWVYRNLDVATVMCFQMKKLLSESTVFPSEKIEVVYGGADIERFEPNNFNKSEIRQKFGLPLDKIIFGNIGRIEWLKGQDLALEAFGQAQAENAFFVVAGNLATKEYGEDLNEIVEKYNLKDKFKMLPFTENVPELMNCFDVFVLPSLCETFGYVNIEAMASSLPVIGTACGGVPEIIVHGETGYLYEAKETEKLAEFIKILSKNEDLRKSMGEKGLARAKQMFDNKQLDRLFFEICERNFDKIS